MPKQSVNPLPKTGKVLADILDYNFNEVYSTLIAILEDMGIPSGIGSSRIFDSPAKRDTYFGEDNGQGGYNYNNLLTGVVIIVIEIDIVKFYKWAGADNPVSYDNANWELTSFQANTVYSNPSSLQVGNIDLYSTSHNFGIRNLNDMVRHFIIGQEHDTTRSYPLQQVDLAPIEFVDRQLLFDEVQPTVPYTYTFIFPNNEGVKWWSALEIKPYEAGELIFEVRIGSVDNDLIVIERISVTQDDVDSPTPPQYELQNNIQLDPDNVIVITLKGIRLKGHTVLGTWFPYFKAGEQLMTFNDVATLNIFDLTKDPTGFVDSINIVVSYDKITRRITLTHPSGYITYLYRGRIKKLTSPWVSSQHIAGTINYFLKSIDGENFIWESAVWSFSDIQIAVARYAPSTMEYYGIRECHGIMAHDTHQELHDQIGTYRVSGLTIDLNSILIDPVNGSVTNAGNRPIVNSGVIKDEDLETIIPQWLDNDVYSVLYFDASNNSQFTYTSPDMYLYNNANNILRYNPVGQGLVDVSNNHYINMYCLHVPVTSDTSSQKYRNVWIVGQNQYSTLTSAQAEDPRSINYGNITGAIPEQVIYAVITFQYQNGISSVNSLGKCKIAATPRYVTGSRSSTITTQSFTVSHNSTVDRDIAGNHTKLIPLVNSETSLQITKADSTPIMTFDSVNNRVIINEIPEYADNAAAISAGLVIGTEYRTGDILKIVHS